MTSVGSQLGRLGEMKTVRLAVRHAGDREAAKRTVLFVSLLKPNRDL
jgi:hypothetical protein